MFLFEEHRQTCTSVYTNAANQISRRKAQHTKILILVPSTTHVIVTTDYISVIIQSVFFFNSLVSN